MPAPILLTRPAGSPRQDLDSYREAGGYEALRAALAGDPAKVRETIEAAGLRGRGGAAFPVAVKWKLAAGQGATHKHVVANGGEHEPGSDKDKFLVEHYPHAVIEGMAICGFATGASKGWLYLIQDMAGPLRSAELALEEARAAGLLGQDLFGSGFGFDIEIHRAPTTYVAGEESAAIDSIDGGEGMPRAKPPYPGERGVQGLPTTVNNVETLAHVAWILRHGALAYRGIGTDQSPGTMLFTLPDSLNNPGVVEAPFGTTWRELLEGIGGGTRSGRAIRAVQPAMSCGFVGGDQLDTPIAHETLKPLGSSPGCGGVRILEEGGDAVEFLLGVARFFMKEQCGQCPPCGMQTGQFVRILEAVQAGKGPGFDEQIRKLAGFARGKGYCSLIEMAAAPLLSGLDRFADDLARAAGAGG